MSSSREESPDWLRSFQAPTHSALTLSSDSPSSLQDSPSRKDLLDLEEPSPCKSSRISDKHKKVLSSDSQSSLQDSPSRKDIVDLEKPSPRKSSRILEKRKKVVLSDSQSSLQDSPSSKETIDIKKPSPCKSSRISEKGKKQTTTIGESGAKSPSNKPSKAKDLEEPSPRKSSRISEKGKKQTTTIGESGAESPSNKPLKAKSPERRVKVEDQTPGQKKIKASKKRKRGDESDRIVAKEVTLEKYMEPQKPNDSVLMLSSDSELDRNNNPVMEGHIHHGESSDQKTSEFQEEAKVEDVALIGSEVESTSKKASRKCLKVEDQTRVEEDKKNESVKGKGKIDNVEVAEEEASDKHSESHVSSSRLPLVLSEKVHRTKALVECEGDSIDLSGDMGAVGRVVVSDTPSGNHEMYLDLKGTIYKTTIVPSRTFCVVSFGQSEAKIEAIMNDFIQLKPQSNVYEAETMVEGTLEGFSFDSEDETDKMTKVSSQQNDQNEDVEEQTNGKKKGKAEKTPGNARKKGKTVGGKPQAQKRVRKKSQVAKKGKAKK